MVAGSAVSPVVMSDCNWPSMMSMRCRLESVVDHRMLFQPSATSASTSATDVQPVVGSGASIQGVRPLLLPRSSAGWAVATSSLPSRSRSTTSIPPLPSMASDSTGEKLPLPSPAKWSTVPVSLETRRSRAPSRSRSAMAMAPAAVPSKVWRVKTPSWLSNQTMPSVPVAMRSRSPSVSTSATATSVRADPPRGVDCQLPSVERVMRTSCPSVIATSSCRPSPSTSAATMRPVATSWMGEVRTPGNRSMAVAAVARPVVGSIRSVGVEWVGSTS